MEPIKNNMDPMRGNMDAIKKDKEPEKKTAISPEQIIETLSKANPEDASEKKFPALFSSLSAAGIEGS